MTNKINLTDKFKKVNEAFTITMCDNGFLVDIAGEDLKGDWIDKKLLVTTIADLHTLLDQIVQMPRRS
jgi:hypothetical protein